MEVESQPQPPVQVEASSNPDIGSAGKANRYLGPDGVSILHVVCGVKSDKPIYFHPDVTLQWDMPPALDDELLKDTKHVGHNAWESARETATSAEKLRNEAVHNMRVATAVLTAGRIGQVLEVSRTGDKDEMKYHAEVGSLLDHILRGDSYSNPDEYRHTIQTMEALLSFADVESQKQDPKVFEVAGVIADSLFYEGEIKEVLDKQSLSMVAKDEVMEKVRDASKARVIESLKE